MTTRHRLVLQNGNFRMIYAPGLDQLAVALGADIKRASHVEPDPEQRVGGTWYVDLTPSGGSVCYTDENGNPFTDRQQALDFEKRWLEENWLLRKEHQIASSNKTT